MKWLAVSLGFCGVLVSCGFIHPNEKDKEYQKEDEANDTVRLSYLIVCFQPGSLYTGGYVEGDAVLMTAIGGFLSAPSGCIHKGLSSGFIYNFDTNAQLTSPIAAGQNLVCKCSSSLSNSNGSWFRAPALVNPPGTRLSFIAHQGAGPFTQYSPGDFLVCAPGDNGCPNGFQYQIGSVP